MRQPLSIAIVGAALLAACGGRSETFDATPGDGVAVGDGSIVDGDVTVADGGLADGGLADGGLVDAAPLDAAPPDGGVVEQLCWDCHGDATSAAPPADTTGAMDITARGVGAHRSHLRTSNWHRDVRCDDCHVVPPTNASVGHVDSALPAELVWSAVAGGAGTTPTFDGVTCGDAYCHGVTLSGGWNTAPRWSTGEPLQAICGSCHGLPPPPPHPAAQFCASCHPSVDFRMPYTAPENHIDGVVEINELACDSCHGQGGDPAPPRAVDGATGTDARGVGAHRQHLAPSTWHAQLACSECHVVPSTVNAAGHVDTPTPAELTFGALATADGAAPGFDGVTCAGAYCHGATLQPGGTDTAPTWTRVDGSQDACGTCHGLPPGGTHPIVPADLTICARCHAAVLAPDGSFAAPALHIDGIVEVSATTCDACHGSTTNAAPPRGVDGATAPTARGVGAHQSHLRDSTWRAPIDCTECHLVPTTAGSVGHLDTALPAEVTFGPRATADLATPSWNGTTCSGAYCHGATLPPGGTDTTPTWTLVDGTQAACGTCHGLPPGGAHPSVSGAAPASCSPCHSAVIAADGSFADPTLHVDGRVQVSDLPCDACHGGGGEAAPPRDVAGNLATTVRGVGAHRAHLATSTWHAPIACTECHVVPATADAPGHRDTALPAEVLFGPRATADTATPTWNGTTCSGAYCHGATLRPGGSNTAPTWTTVDGSQDACGTCHGLPPGGGHPPVNGAAPASCHTCHPAVIATDGSFADPALHVDGTVEVISLTCDTCHGGAGGPAPPRDTRDNTLTTARGVGAHQSHLATSTWRRSMACTECHAVPSTPFAAGHFDTPLPAELTWGPLATADLAAPSFDGTSCSGAYCHGATLQPGGSDTTPAWTQVDGTQAACGTCHGLPPGGTHPLIGSSSRQACGMCHAAVIDLLAGTFVAPQLHVDGVVEAAMPHPNGWADPAAHGAAADDGGLDACKVCHGANLTGGLSGVSCSSCHSGWETNCTFCHGGVDNQTGAPPDGVSGELARGTMAVGAHTMHVTTTLIHVARDCTRCHVKPTSALSPGHIDGDGRAEVTFDALNPVGTFDRATGTCGASYCHGTGRASNGSTTWTIDPTLVCSSCHNDATTPSTSFTMSGQHRRHVKSQSVACRECHNTVVNSAPAILATGLALHVDGTIQVSLRQGGTWNASTKRCAPACHGSQSW